ncbi:unnamed protein product, partial [Rotaria sp. Silwood2]
MSIQLKKIEKADRGSSLLPAFNQILVNDVVQNFVLCDKFRSIITYKCTTGSCGLKKHLASCEKNSSSSSATQSTITIYYRNNKSILPEKLKKQITSAYLDFITLDSRPFEIASGIGFQQFIQMIYNPGRLSSNSQSIEIFDFLPHPTTNVFNLTYNELVDIFNDSHYDNFESLDKDLLSHICNFLQVFDEIITTLSDETQPTLHKVIPLRMVLIDHCVPKAKDSL